MTINLEENKIAFGLLSKEEQEHLNNWPHGLLHYEGEDSWWHCETQDLQDYYVYRTIPAPVETERQMTWFYGDSWGSIMECEPKSAHDMIKNHGGFAFRIEFDATTGDNPTIVKETFDG